ncbi:MAG: MBL fold metallo-hydrolase [Clostridia bacterium]|nr:MBL fold metallo-hydrolase [Clostridia bacterium]
MKKIFCVLLALITVLSLVTACADSDPNPEEATPDGKSTEETTSKEVIFEESTVEETVPSGTESGAAGSSAQTDTEEETTEEETTRGEGSIEPPRAVPLVLDGFSCVTIVYPNEYKDCEINVANDLASVIQELSGVLPTVMSDAALPDDTKLEILIGDTNRTHSMLVSEALKPGQLAIQMAGGSLMINGSLGDTLYYALEFVKEQLQVQAFAAEGMLVLPQTAMYLGYVPMLREEFFTVDSLNASGVYECGDQCYMLLFEKATSSTMYHYLDILTGSGMVEKEAPRTVLDNTNNLYSTYFDETVMATVFYTDHNKQLRVMLEPVAKNGYYSYVNENTEKVCEPLFMQVGIGEHRGMCYIFRFSNGEFFVYDGGFDDAEKDYSSLQNCQRIVSLLRQHAPDPNDIHIAGWLITHPHIDHIGALVYFCNNYADDETITLETVLINIPSDFVADQDTSSTGLSKKMRYYRQILEKVDETGTVLHKTHAGQVLQFGDATLEILYTHEMRMPQTLYGSNNLSIVSRMTLEGQTFLITGDTHTYSNKVMEPMYQGQLKCDFYQTPHHGDGPSTNTLAKVANPTWVLWPCAQDRYDSASQKSHNDFFFSSASNVKSMFVSDVQTQIFNLPFDGTNYTVIQNTTIK